MPLRCRKSVTHQMIAEVSKGAAALREACAAEPAYQTADDLWKGLKRNDLEAQLVLTFAQRLRFNKGTRHSLPAAKRQVDKRWVRILRQENWNLYLLMLLWGREQMWMPTDRKQQHATCGNACGNRRPQCARPRALNVAKNRYVMRCECARPRALSSSLSALD